MVNKNTLTPQEEIFLLKITKILAGEISTANAPAAFSMDLTDEESVAQAARSAREIADRRRAGRGGRVLVDATDEDREVRQSLRDWMRRTGRLKKYGVEEKND